MKSIDDPLFIHITYIEWLNNSLLAAPYIGVNKKNARMLIIIESEQYNCQNGVEMEPKRNAQTMSTIFENLE